MSSRRSSVKHLRICTRAAMDAGAVQVSYATGSKHLMMTITLADGRTIRQAVPKGSQNEQTWWANWTRQRVQRALAGRDR